MHAHAKDESPRKKQGKMGGTETNYFSQEGKQTNLVSEKGHAPRFAQQHKSTPQRPFPPRQRGDSTAKVCAHTQNLLPFLITCMGRSRCI